MDTSFTSEMSKLAKLEGVPMKIHKLIYNVLDDIKALLEDAPEGEVGTVEIKANAIIKEIFEIKLGKADIKKIAGISISKGNLNKRLKYRVLREGRIVARNLELSNLKLHKAEVNEVKAGQECGVSFFEYKEFQKGDRIEAYELKAPKKKQE